MPRRQIEHRGAHDRVIAHFQSMAIFENQGSWRRRFRGSDLRGALGSRLGMSPYSIRRWRNISPISSPAALEDGGAPLIVGFLVLISRIFGRIGISGNAIPSPVVGNETVVAIAVTMATASFVALGHVQKESAASTRCVTAGPERSNAGRRRIRSRMPSKPRRRYRRRHTINLSGAARYEKRRQQQQPHHSDRR